MKLEMHAHTAEVSPCGQVRAADGVNLIKSAGYDGVVITDHFNNYVLEGFNCENDRDRVKRYLTGWNTARLAGEKCGLTVLLGAEVCLHRFGYEDYLLYGLTEDFLFNNPFMYDYDLPTLSERCRSAGILLFQAHPSRPYLHHADPAFLDGAEVINANPRHQNNNDVSRAWAAEHHLLFSSGSDFHCTEDVARGGIETAYPITDSIQLPKLLKSGEYTLLGK